MADEVPRLPMRPRNRIVAHSRRIQRRWRQGRRHPEHAVTRSAMVRIREYHSASSRRPIRDHDGVAHGGDDLRLVTNARDSEMTCLHSAPPSPRPARGAGDGHSQWRTAAARQSTRGKIVAEASSLPDCIHRRLRRQGKTPYRYRTVIIRSRCIDRSRVVNDAKMGQQSAISA